MTYSLTHSISNNFVVIVVALSAFVDVEFVEKKIKTTFYNVKNVNIGKNV